MRKDDDLLAAHIEEEMERYASIDKRLKAIEDQLTDISEIWVQSRGVLNFVKLMAAIAVALASVYTFFQSNFTIVPK